MVLIVHIIVNTFQHEVSNTVKFYPENLSVPKLPLP